MKATPPLLVTPVALRNRAPTMIEEAQRLGENRRAGAITVTAAAKPKMTLDLAEPAGR